MDEDATGHRRASGKDGARGRVKGAREGFWATLRLMIVPEIPVGFENSPSHFGAIDGREDH